MLCLVSDVVGFQVVVFESFGIFYETCVDVFRVFPNIEFRKLLASNVDGLIVKAAQREAFKEEFPLCNVEYFKERNHPLQCILLSKQH